MNAAAPLPEPNMGQPVPRYDGVAKVTGRAAYGSDQPVRNPAHAFFVTSAIARGRIAAIDENDARSVPGVVEIVTHRNRPPLQPAKLAADGLHALEAAPALEGPDVHYEGEIVAMIVADTFEAAREAAHRLVVRYDRQTPGGTFGDPGVDVELKSTVKPGTADVGLGDVEAALARSATVLDVRYTTPTQHHNAIEMYATTAVWEGETLTLFEGAQIVYATKNVVAGQLGIPPENVHVVSPFIGGGFGAKAALTPRTALVAAVARRLGRPVKLVLTREQCFKLAGYRQETQHHVRMGVDRDGRFTAYHHDLTELTSRRDPFGFGGIDNNAAMYRFPAVSGINRMALADRGAPVAMRSPTEMQCLFALESAVDELAIGLAMDPVELRRLNDTDRNMVTGKLYTSRSLMQCFDQAAAAFGWSRRDPAPGSMRDGDWLIGWGCASAHYPTYATSAVARVRYGANGHAVLETAGSDLGTGQYTVFAQETALRLGIPVERVQVRLGDSRLPPGPIAGGSTGSATGCSAIRLACDAVLAKLGIDAGTDVAARATAFETLGVGEVEAQGNYWPAGSQVTGTASAYEGTPAFNGGVHAPKTQFAFGAHFVEVRIHRRTREIRVPRMVGAFAAGRILNPRTARSQLMGGMIWGISSALFEATEFDRREARYVNNDLAEYLMPVNADIGAVDVIFVPEVDEECNPAGVKGIGELGNVGITAAVANAVYHATGQRIRDLPITLDKLVRG